MEYNNKINTNGEYRKLHGWTIVSEIYDDFKFIENYLSKNTNIKDYYSPLPSSSYHITLYNLNHKPKYTLSQDLKFIENFKPDDNIDDSFYKLHFECKKSWSHLRLIIDNIYVGNTIAITFKISSQNGQDSGEIKVMDKFRDNISNLCEGKDNMGIYHMTLAYNYKKIKNENEYKRIMTEIEFLKIFLKNQSVTIRTPDIYYFSDMTKYISVF